MPEASADTPERRQARDCPRSISLTQPKTAFGALLNSGVTHCLTPTSWEGRPTGPQHARTQHSAPPRERAESAGRGSVGVTDTLLEARDR